MKNISVADLTGFVLQVLESYGVSREDAQITADALVTTDSWGVATHGTKLLSGYGKRLEKGGLKPDGRPKILREGPSWALIDGDLALGMVTSVFAMKAAIAKARQTGIAISVVRNSCHFGAAGYYAHVAAKDNMIGLAMANDAPSVAAPGSKGPVLGSNPIAFGSPAGERPPVVLDISTAVVAGGKIRQAMANGKPIPEGWLIDSEGRPTTDGNAYPYNGSLLPMAGHKGYGIAILIEILSGVLSGAHLRDKILGWMDAPGTPTEHGHAFIAIDPVMIAGLNPFNSSMEELISGIKAAPVVPEIDALSMPGEIEHKKRAAALEHGIPLGDDVVESLRIAATQASVPLPASLA